MKILVTGVSGYIGSLLAPRLVRDGHVVRGLSRDPSRVALDIPVAAGDAVSGAGLMAALKGVDLAYYLLHSMEPATDGRFEDRERSAAEHFATAARNSGVQRVVYLGGLIPIEGPVSAHLSSRLAVERTLLSATPSSVALRASIVIGAQSRSFRFLVRLIERLPVLVLPAWRTNRTSPIDERDVIELLARAGTDPAVHGMSLDAGGPEAVSYGELIDRIRYHLCVSRPTIGLRKLTVTPIASRVSATISGEQHALVGPLMDSLDHDLLAHKNLAADLLGVRLHSLDAAIERALREWEMTEPLAAR
jgi:uncharacterized protein YbjT (DUF2867 family)